MGVMFGMVKWLERVTTDAPAAPAAAIESEEKDIL